MSGQPPHLPLADTAYPERQLAAGTPGPVSGCASTQEHRQSLLGQIKARAGIILVIALFTSIAAGGGCASIQETDAATGLPRVIGWGSVTNIPVAKGTLCRVRSPGLSLRLHSFAPGLTFGWHETLLFLPKEAEEGQTKLHRPVAIRTRNYGIGVAAYCLIIGGDSAFEVYEPTPGSSFIQTIHFVPGCLTNTIITKEQIK